jgi:predicted HicB family RNase H-like nuclease
MFRFKKVTIRLTEEMHTQLRVFAIQHGVTLQKLLEDMIQSRVLLDPTTIPARAKREGRRKR